MLGSDIRADPGPVRRRVGVVPEDLALFDRLTGAETLAFIGSAHGMDSGTLDRRAGELLELMDLTEAAGSLAVDYSHGMRKKLALAVALLPGPALLFLDEPFEGIDAVAARQIIAAAPADAATRAAWLEWLFDAHADDQYGLISS